MPDARGRPRTSYEALEERVSALEELVDGHEPWSHRVRLHALEDAQAAAELLKEATAALRDARKTEQRWRWSQVREWGGFALAAAAIALSTHPWS
jgi:hypothetical protein